MKTKILMIYPEFPTTYWSLKYALRFVGKKAATIPLGLLTVASLLPEDYDVKLTDMNVEKLNENDIRNADMVFISSMIVQKQSFDEVVALCNRLKVPVVAGGPYPTSSYNKITGVDHFVLNEAENTLPSFIHDYENGSLQKVYSNSEKPDITKTPPPRFDLIDFKKYNNIALQNSRGCPFNCEFCDIIELFGRVPRFKDPEQFVREMDLVYKHGFRGSLFVVDDNFIGNKKKVRELLHHIIDWQKANNYPFSLFTEASLNLAADDELLKLMTEAGFDMVFMGIETPDTESLKSCNKNQNLNIDLYLSIDKIQRAGIEVTGGFIVGFDNDTEDIFDRQVEFIQKAGISMAMVGLLGALPGTQLYRRLNREGRLKTGDDFSGNNTHNLQMNFIPVMPETKLVRGYKKVISEIYSPERYFERCYTFLEKLPDVKMKTQRGVSLMNIRALFLSLLKQGFSSYSIHYFRFLWRVLIHNTRRFPRAVELAIKGYHFFIITRETIKADDLSIQMNQEKKLLENTSDFLAAIPGMQIHAAAEYIRILINYRKKMERKYSHLSMEVQLYLREQYEDYIKKFNTCISGIRKFHHNGSAGE